MRWIYAFSGKETENERGKTTAELRKVVVVGLTLYAFYLLLGLNSRLFF